MKTFNGAKRQIIELDSDYDERKYLIQTSILPEQVDRVNGLIKNNGYGYTSIHCGHEYDCCGCFCGFSSKAVNILGEVYIAVKERFNY